MGDLNVDGRIPVPCRRKRSESGSSGPGLGKGPRAGQTPSGMCLSDALQFSYEDVAGAVRVPRAPAASSV